MKQILSDTVPLLNIPSWATHIAIRPGIPKIGMALYSEREGGFATEDISSMKDGQIASVYDERYWEFVSVDEFKDLERANGKQITFEEAKEIADSLEVEYKFTNYIAVAKDGTEVQALNISRELVVQDSDPWHYIPYSM